ncbi:DUF3800 domain-containing protein [Arthrobacter sp. MI7-26]|uniref:DUF3800 domain-containing protein n=1 Tax=Arthrobacter sp. MI7-26 TaxID=2993653 RepID=UPI0022496A5C|nr:DUF3800 domain-containing protein [Arthrobacter sp. MI7-26]MCX2748380.1 DUF3800 domain-containing protein [Arthrobacter sp. MI7-26]
MLVCYIDESGDEQPLRTPTDPPVLVIAGLVVNHTRAKTLIMDFLQIKKEFNPVIGSDSVMLSELIRFEVKGSELRKDIRSGKRRAVRRAIGFLDKVMNLLEEHGVSIVGEIFIKGQAPLKRWVYSDAVVSIAEQFEAQLRTAQVEGTMILDARTKSKNVPSVHTVTTQRFRRGGDPYPHLIEAPVFGHSDAHVVLQIADILASAFLFPMACASYCNSLLDNVHIDSAYDIIRDRYGARLRLLESRYLNADGRKVGGIRVCDHMNRQPSLALYQQMDFVYATAASPLKRVAADAASR